VSVWVVAGGLVVLPVLPARPQIRLDVVSGVLACGWMVALVYGLAEVPAVGWRSGEVILPLAAALVLLAAFAGRQGRVAS
jgi:hypothetical protein